MGWNIGSSRIQSVVLEPVACEIVIGSQLLDSQMEGDSSDMQSRML